MVSAAPFRGGSRDASVVFVIEIEPQRLTFVEEDGRFNTDLELLVVAASPNGKERGRSAHHLVRSRLQPQTHAAVLREGLRVTSRLPLPAGHYRLQVGVRDTTSGAIGTVLTDLEVPDFCNAPLAISGVAVASAAAAHVPTAQPDPALAGMLPGPPTARRAFSVDDSLLLVTEVYGHKAETSHPVTVSTTISAAGGGHVHRATQIYGTEERKGREGRWQHSTAIPPGMLVPGWYVLRIEATSASGGGTAVRELEFDITPAR